jgi:uracil-DNA glycosylase
MTTLLKRVRDCTVCEPSLPHGPRPVLQLDARARILIAGQAPGRRVHETGVPFDDPSGNRLREWMGLTRETFYDPSKIAILPMGFCYPGAGKSGDLPPRPECAPQWRSTLLERLTSLRLTLVIGQYAIAYHLNDEGGVSDVVRRWESYGPATIPLPHPSPRNTPWLKLHPWFERDLLPILRTRVVEALS